MKVDSILFKIGTVVISVVCLFLALFSFNILGFSVTGTGEESLSVESDTLSESAVGEGVEAKSYYDFLPRDVMPILGFVAMPNENGYTANGYTNPSFITRTHFQTYKDAGFNIISGLYEREPFNTYEIRKAVDLCEELGLVYFVQDLDVRGDMSQEAMTELIGSKWYLTKKAFGGISLKDEPSVKEFSSMSKATQALKELMPNKVTHATLFPWGASEAQLGIYDMPGTSNEAIWARYEKYVREYQAEVNPRLLAYDCYLFFLENESLLGMSNSRKHLLEFFVRSLSLYRELAIENDIPFWVTIAPYNHNSKIQVPKKRTEWSVNVSLAYGAKGIQYYTYWTLLEQGSQAALENHQYAGLVTLGGTPHNTYYSVQDINRNIQAVDGILMTSESKGIMQFGNQVLPVPEEDVLSSYGNLKSITGGDALVGCFDHNGKTVYYIMHDSITEGIKTFNISFDKKCNVHLLNGDIDDSVNGVYSVGVNLSGGEAVLIEVE